MENPNETLVMAWLGLLLAPPILFGLWMRFKLYQSEQGEAFLVDREVADSRARRATRWTSLGRNDDEYVDTAGRAARGVADVSALQGSHGDDVAYILKKSIPFMIGYAVYAALGIAIGVLLIF